MSKKFYLIGIKGSGMTPLATLLKKQGHEVIGSDVDKHFFTEQFLIDNQISYYNFDEFDFDSDYTVIVGNSFKSDFSEVVKAKAQGNEMYYYFEYLGLLSKEMFSIAVTGTHGKTTTTTIVKNVFGFDHEISYLIGDGNGSSSKDSNIFIFEACEYKNHFHKYFPNYAIITNVDLDHLDFFTSQEMYNESYLEFANNVTEKLIVCGDDAMAYELYKDNPKAVFYGVADYCDYQIRNIEYLSSGCAFTITVEEKSYHFDVPIYGKHNVLNFAAAIVCASLYGIDIETINAKYKNVENPKRRFEEYLYEEQIVIDDYAHHPDELKAFLDSVFQKYPNKKVICVFEPHTVSRLEEHYQAFATELNRCDEQIVMKVEVPLRDCQKYGDDHLESDVMLEYLNNGSFHPDNLNEYLQKQQNCVVTFIGATVSKYTDPYISAIDLIFCKK